MAKEYVLTVGLEIHAELATQSKMFCGCPNNPDEERPNANTCPICMGHPGTLPVINKEAVKHVLKVGLALGAELADFTEFDRKNYFYPDIPKGYQLSQYKYPLVKGGSLTVSGFDPVAITRVHLEEDTATSKHEEGDYSLVDFNRAGVPLMELVTEPVIHSPEQAGAFAQELQLLLRTLGAGEANMEKGEMRVEANISVAEKGVTQFGTKVEVKNLNSFKSAERAIAYEMKRHIDVLEAIERGETPTEKLVQETRGFDEKTGKTFSQRLKENSHDYRYFPDPDLPKLKLSEIADLSADALKKEMPELPWVKRARYAQDFGIKAEGIEIFTRDIVLGRFFEDVIAALGASGAQASKEDIQRAANYITSDLVGLAAKDASVFAGTPIENALKKITPTNFATLISMISKAELSSRGAKDTLAIMYAGGADAQDGDPKKIAEAKGFIQKNDEGALKIMLEKIVADNPSVVADYKAGKAVSLQFLLGQAMKISKGSANPQLLKTILEALLK